MGALIHCNFAADLARFERDQIDADHRADAREAAELELLAGEYNPSTPANFAEAMAEMFASETGEHHAKALLEIAKLDPSSVGHYLNGLSAAYWTSLAAWKAGKAH